MECVIRVCGRAVSFSAALQVVAVGETITVSSTQIGTTPALLGYNLGHFMPDSNAADWFRYSGVDAARVFINVADIEPSDDIAPVGDGVNSESAFFNRCSLLRANAASATVALSNTYVRWSVFSGNYGDVSSGSNRIRLTHALGNLRDRGVSILANITASPTRFPITGDADWPGRWELWQHYYAQSFLLSRDYGVRNFSMFNEPNGWEGMTEEDWLKRYRICSDAIQSGVADMNSRYGKNVMPQIFAANTANGAEKYNTIGPNAATTDTWGHDAVANRHLRLDGSSSLNWQNLHVYNYQKYTTRTHAGGGFSGYLDDYDAIRNYLDIDMPGEPSLPIALTEFNVRTGALYDTLTTTQDSPSDFTALGANCVALAGRGVDQLYVFKFGQTASASNYGVAKNGTHYVENGSGTNNYGGATQCAEVYRLFVKAARGGRARLYFTTTAGAAPTTTGGVWSMVTHDPIRGVYHVFVVNKEAAAIPLGFDFSALPVPAGNPVFVEEVSGGSNGGVVRFANLQAGKLAEADLPGQSVWLVTVPEKGMAVSSRGATADTELGDGTSKAQAGGGNATMQVRADGTANGRRVSLIRIPVPAGNSPGIHSVLLELNAATSEGTTPIKAHVYGVTDPGWTESSVTWTGMNSLLKQGQSDGNQIRNNIVAGQGTDALMLGQLVVDSPVMSRRRLDVTDFVKSRSDGFASFFVVQDHRWDIAQPGLTNGDTQPAGMRISSKESAAGGPRLVALVQNDSGVVPVTREASIRGGSFSSSDVDEAATGYLMVKFNSGLESARKAYFQFDLPLSGVDFNAPATFHLGFNNTFAQQVRLWGVRRAVPEFSGFMTWNNAPANDISGNGLLESEATAIGADVRINPGSGLTPFVFNLPRLGDHVFGNQVTLVLSGVDDAANASGGLRIAPGSATLEHAPRGPGRPWSDWRQSEFGAAWENESIAGVGEDPDHDGLPNLLEYALGMDPAEVHFGGLPKVLGTGFRFNRNPAHFDLRLTIQVAVDLDGGWTDAAVSINGAPFVPVTNDMSVSETGGEVTAIPGGIPSHRFLRLKAELMD